MKPYYNYWYKTDLKNAFEYLKGIPGWSIDQRDKQAIIPRNLLGFFPSFIHVNAVDFGPLRKAAHEIFDELTLKDGNWKLRPYQHIGCDFIRANKRVLLADVPRSGKSATIVASHDLNNGPMLVVGPKMARGIWQLWFQKRWPNARIEVLKGRKADFTKLEKADAIFVNHDILAQWGSLMWKPGMFVIDEAHNFASSKTKRYRAALLFATASQRVVLATGTPLWNKIGNAHSLLNLVEPAGFGSLWDFNRAYLSARSNEWGGQDTGQLIREDELKMRVKNLMLRRTWDEIVDQLPPVTRTVELIELTPEDRLKIDVSLEKSRVGGLATLIGDQAKLRSLFALQNKVGTAIELARAHIENGESVVLWCWHKEVAEALETLCVGNDWATEVITGATKDKDRMNSLVNWRSWNAGVLIMTLGVGQTAIDLSHSRHAIFVELDYTPAVVSQAEMRTWAVERPMTVEYVITDHPVEMSIVKGLLRKAKIAERTGLPAADTSIDFLESVVGDEALMDMDEDLLLGSLFDEDEDE